MMSITCENLKKTYRSTNALDGITLQIPENRITGLIGRNGAGKTTFLKLCAGYLKPTSGSIRVMEQPVFDNLDVLGDMIFVDEEVQYDTTMTLTNILQLAAVYYPRWDAAFAKRLLDYFELPLYRKYKRLSKGMKTQFNIVTGLCSRTSLVLFDEPTLGLDAAFRKDFYDILLRDYMQNPRSMVISSHLLSEFENLLEDIVLIDKGKLVFHKSMEEVQNSGLILNGKREMVEKACQGRTVYHRDLMGDALTVGVHNDFNEKEISEMKAGGISLSRMSAQDVCIYITSKGKEGVFHDEE